MNKVERAEAVGEMVCDNYPLLDRGSFRLFSLPLVGKLGVRCSVEGKAGKRLKVGLEKVLGCSWEESPCRYRGDERVGRRCLWMGPDEWLLLCREEEVCGLKEGLMGVGEKEGVLVACVEQTDQYEHICVEGERVRSCLEGCVMMDFGEESFGEGSVVGTLLGHVRVVMVCVGRDSFEILVRRSEAPYVWRMLELTSRFYG